jgi:hypothetical protein
VAALRAIGLRAGTDAPAQLGALAEVVSQAGTLSPELAATASTADRDLTQALAAAATLLDQLVWQ